MVAITATNTTTVSAQSLLVRSRLQQAQREADLAESEARQLRSQADEQERTASSQQGRVQALSYEANKANSTYGPFQRSAATEVPKQTQDFLVRLYQGTSTQFAASGNPLKSKANAAPVINGQGQTTGRIVNLAV
jgi:hypothetical protein